MKKLLSIIISLLVVLILTGCNNNTEGKVINKNEKPVKEQETILSKNETLNCSGDFLFTWGFMVGKGPTPEGVEQLSYAFSSTTGVGQGEYIFTFDENNLINMNSTETLSASYSKQVNTDDIEIDGCEVSKNNNGRVVLKCNYGENTDYVKSLNTNANTKEKLKDVLEKRTSLTCN